MESRTKDFIIRKAAKDEWEEAMRVSGNRMGLTMARQKYRQRKD